MGLLDLVPLGRETKAATTGVIGAGVGTLTGYVLGKSGSSKELKSVKGRVSELENQLADAEKQKQSIALLKISMLRQLAWRDGQLADSEKLFIYEYIMAEPDLNSDLKIEAMHEISNSPTMFSYFVNFMTSNKNKFPPLTREQVDGFEATLKKLADCDGVYDQKEEKYIKQIIEACGS